MGEPDPGIGVPAVALEHRDESLDRLVVAAEMAEQLAESHAGAGMVWRSGQQLPERGLGRGMVSRMRMAMRLVPQRIGADGLLGRAVFGRGGAPAGRDSETGKQPSERRNARRHRTARLLLLCHRPIPVAQQESQHSFAPAARKASGRRGQPTGRCDRHGLRDPEEFSAAANGRLNVLGGDGGQCFRRHRLSAQAPQLFERPLDQVHQRERQSQHAEDSGDLGKPRAPGDDGDRQERV